MKLYLSEKFGHLRYLGSSIGVRDLSMVSINCCQFFSKDVSVYIHVSLGTWVTWFEDNFVFICASAFGYCNEA